MNNYEASHKAISSIALKKQRKYIASMHEWFKTHAYGGDVEEIEEQCRINKQERDEIEWTISVMKYHLDVFLEFSAIGTTPRSFFYEDTYQRFRDFCITQEAGREYEDFYSRYYEKKIEELL